MMEGLEAPINTPPPIPNGDGGGSGSGSSNQGQPTPPAPPAPAAQPSYIPSSEPEKETFGDMMKSMNWVELGFSMLGAAALYFVITYYNTSSKVNKTYMTQVENKIDDLNIKVADIQSAMNREAVLPNTLDGGFV
jgi:hypothetical protein